MFRGWSNKQTGSGERQKRDFRNSWLHSGFPKWAKGSRKGIPEERQFFAAPAGPNRFEKVLDTAKDAKAAEARLRNFLIDIYVYTVGYIPWSIPHGVYPMGYPMGRTDGRAS